MNVVPFELTRGSIAGRYPWVGAAVFVDDEPLTEKGVGSQPEDLLEQLRSPSPSQIQVRICSCGVPGCWSLAATVLRKGGQVIWDSWCDRVEDMDGFPSTSVDRLALHFRAQQYATALDQLEYDWRAW